MKRGFFAIKSLVRHTQSVNSLRLMSGSSHISQEKGNPPQKKSDVEQRIFDAKIKISSSYRQYLRGKDINRYEVNPLESRYIKYGVWLAEPRPAANFDAPQKILVRQTGDEIIAALDNQQMLCLNNIHVLVPHDPSLNMIAILTMLNSKLITWCLRSMNPEAGEALAEVKKEFVELLPVPNLKKMDSLRKIGERLIELKASKPSEIRDRQIKMSMTQADSAVLDLFGITSIEASLIG